MVIFFKFMQNLKVNVLHQQLPILYLEFLQKPVKVQYMEMPIADKITKRVSVLLTMPVHIIFNLMCQVAETQIAIYGNLWCFYFCR